MQVPPSSGGPPTRSHKMAISISVRGVVPRLLEQRCDHLGHVRVVVDEQDPKSSSRISQSRCNRFGCRWLLDVCDQRQADQDGATLTGAFAGDVDTSAMKLDDAFDQREAKPTLGAFKGDVRLKEWLKNPWQQLRRGLRAVERGRDGAGEGAGVGGGGEAVGCSGSDR
jgi:hypothetical protein